MMVSITAVATLMKCYHTSAT